MHSKSTFFFVNVLHFGHLHDFVGYTIHIQAHYKRTTLEVLNYKKLKHYLLYIHIY